MGTIQTNRKKIYDATVNIIYTLHVQKGALTEEEMNCLLSVLDIALMAKGDHALIDVLQEWEASHPSEELQEILKATLLNIDFSSMDSQSQNIETIRDLVRYNKELRDG